MREVDGAAYLRLIVFGTALYIVNDMKRAVYALRLNPKALLLYAAAQCSAQTALMIMQKERITPKRFEISYSADNSPE